MQRSAINTFLRERGLLLLVITAFILLKIPHLFYPYYWDESWPYVPAVNQMFHHGISLMPTAVEAELSRGHPLFFHAIAALWMHLFGSSHLAMHSFGLLISVLFLISIYEAGLRLFNQNVACIALLLVAMQVMFFVQSSFVLLEVLVAFLVFIALYFYVTGKYIGTILSLTMLFYTKESGLILGAVLGIDAAIGLFNKRQTLKQRWLNIVSIALPCVFIILFFLIQKHVRGWYVFPLYSGLVEHNWLNFYYKFRMNSLRLSFGEDYRYLYFLLLLLISVATAIKTKNYRFLALIPSAIFIFILIDNQREYHFMKKPMFLGFLLAYFYATRSFLRFFEDQRQKKFILLCAIFIMAFMIFSATNFFSYRYLLANIIPTLFLTAVFVERMIKEIGKVFWYPAIAAMIVIAVISFKFDQDHGDCDLDAFAGMEAQQRVVDYLVQNNDFDKVIYTGGFMAREHLTDPVTGFLHSVKNFPKTFWSIGGETKLALFDNIEPDDYYPKFREDTSFKLIYRFEKRSVWTEIYERKNAMQQR